MLVAHLADTHLGLMQYGYPWRENDFYNAFLEAFNIAIREGVDVIAISGDMFDRYKPPNRALRVAMDAVKKASDSGIKVYSILGEHDIPRRSDDPPQTLIPNIKLLGTSKTPLYDIVRVEGKDYLIVGVSHHPAKYLQGLRSTLSSLREVLRKFNRKSVLMLHQSVKQFFGFEEGLDITDIPPEATYVAMGHLHRRVRARIEGGGVMAYPGSLEIVRADEIEEWLNNGKGFYIVDLSSDEPLIHPINLDIRPQIKVVAKYPNHTLAARVALGKLRSLGVGRKWDKGILHIDIEIEESRKGLGRDAINEVLELVTTNIYVRPRLKIVKKDLRRGDRELNNYGGVDEGEIVKRYLMSSLGIKDEKTAAKVAETVIEIKNALANDDLMTAERLIDELLRFESLWRNKISPPTPSLSHTTVAQGERPRGRSEVSTTAGQSKGKGLLRFLEGRS